ncbi:M4 family metallopeptidase [Vibrio chaetopteri]|uniref:M4 family metallopeptidase n=1 Tax=Vibrio chaetopteri TaxID=3016528 RepID=UPI003AB6E018
MVRILLLCGALFFSIQVNALQFTAKSFTKWCNENAEVGDDVSVNLNTILEQSFYPLYKSDTTADAEKLTAKMEQVSRYLASLQIFTLNVNGQQHIDNNILAITSHHFFGMPNCTGNEPNAFFTEQVINSKIRPIILLQENMLEDGDILVHELTHGIITRTSNLAYQDEPGALNESIADIMAIYFKYWAHKEGLSTKENDWTLYINGKPLRSFKDPKSVNPNHPKHYRERYQGPKDHGGVHINSNILNHMFYLLSEGGKGGEGIGIAHAVQITLTANNLLLTTTSKFDEAALAFVDATEMLYGVNHKYVGSVIKAFEAIGVELPQLEALPDPPINKLLYLYWLFFFSVSFASYKLFKKYAPKLVEQHSGDYKAYKQATPVKLKSAPKSKWVIFDGNQIYSVSDKVTVGRAAHNAIVLPKPSISSTHLEIIANSGHACITDCNSTYGTMIDGQLLPSGKEQYIYGSAQVVLAETPIHLIKKAKSLNIYIGEHHEEIHLAYNQELSLTVGRAVTNDITVSAAETSAHHASILIKKGAVFFADIGSRNGTVINNIFGQWLCEHDELYPLANINNISLGGAEIIIEVA